MRGEPTHLSGFNSKVLEGAIAQSGISLGSLDSKERQVLGIGETVELNVVQVTGWQDLRKVVEAFGAKGKGAYQIRFKPDGDTDMEALLAVKKFIVSLSECANLGEVQERCRAKLEEQLGSGAASNLKDLVRSGNAELCVQSMNVKDFTTGPGGGLAKKFPMGANDLVKEMIEGQAANDCAYILVNDGPQRASAEEAIIAALEMLRKANVDLAKVDPHLELWVKIDGPQQEDLVRYKAFSPLALLAAADPEQVKAAFEKLQAQLAARQKDEKDRLGAAAEAQEENVAALKKELDGKRKAADDEAADLDRRIREAAEQAKRAHSEAQSAGTGLEDLAQLMKSVTEARSAALKAAQKSGHAQPAEVNDLSSVGFKLG